MIKKRYIQAVAIVFLMAQVAVPALSSLVARATGLTEAATQTTSGTYCRMELVKTDSPDPVAPGAELHYTLRLTNTGTGYCTGGGVQLKEYYDERTRFISSVPRPTTGDNLWNFGEVPPGEVNEVQITMRVSDTVVHGDVLTNRACFWTREYNTWVCVDETTTIVGPYCGNGIQEGSEACDGTDGVGAHERCTAECTLETLPYCGDQIKNGDEQCDGADGVGEHQACTEQCTLINLAYCGDQIKNGDEQCDGADGVGAHERCTSACTLEQLTYCGDGIRQEMNDDGGAEECDGADGVIDGTRCTDTCSLEQVKRTSICGVKFNDVNTDGIRDTGEESLSGWTIQLYKKTSNGIIRDLLSRVGNMFYPDEVPGMAVVDDIRECWDARTNQYRIGCGNGATYTLVASAVTTDTGYCFTDVPAGDYIVSEVLQEGWGMVSGSCPIIADGTADYQCHIANYRMPQGPVCGNAVIESPEQCDDGNIISGDGCSATCESEGTGGPDPICGDGVKNQESEQCDGTDGVALHQRCTNECTLEQLTYCGDGTVQNPNGEGVAEACDDGNAVNGDGCSAQCVRETPPVVNPPSGGGGGGGGGRIGGGGFLTLAPRISIDKTVNASTAEAGTSVVYRVIVTNTGNTIVFDPKVVDTLPAGFTFVDGGGSTKTWNLAPMSIGASQELLYTVAIADSVATGSYANKAIATIRDGQAVEDTAIVSVLQPSVLSIEAPEQPVVKGFTTLPDTSGFNASMWLLTLTTLFISTSLSSFFYVYRESQSR